MIEKVGPTSAFEFDLVALVTNPLTILCLVIWNNGGEIERAQLAVGGLRGRHEHCSYKIVSQYHKNQR